MRSARTLAAHTGFYHVILKATGPQMLFREGTEGTDSIERGFARAMTRAEEIPRVAVRAKIGRGESLSLEEMLVCRVHALSNGRALGERQGIESVPIKRKHPTPLAQCNVELFSATQLRGLPLSVA